MSDPTGETKNETPQTTKPKPRKPRGTKASKAVTPLALVSMIDDRFKLLMDDRPPTSSARTPLIFGAVRNVMRDIAPLAKTHQHPDKGFDFRKIDEICANLQPLLAEHGIFYYQSRVLKVEEVERPVTLGTGEVFVQIFKTITVRWRVQSAIDGSYIEPESVGEAMSELHFATPAAQTMAEKTMLCDLFCIPIYGEADPEELTGVRSQPANYFTTPEATSKTSSEQSTIASAELPFDEPLSAAQGAQEPAEGKKARKGGRNAKEPQTAIAAGAQAAQAAPAATAGPLAKGFITILKTNMEAKGVKNAELFAAMKVDSFEAITADRMAEAMAFISAPKE